MSLKERKPVQNPTSSKTKDAADSLTSTQSEPPRQNIRHDSDSEDNERVLENIRSPPSPPDAGSPNEASLKEEVKLEVKEESQSDADVKQEELSGDEAKEEEEEERPKAGVFDYVERLVY